MNLVLKKEMITKLSDDQMKKFVGGLNNNTSKQSCNAHSCNSAIRSPTCGVASCNCSTEVR